MAPHPPGSRGKGSGSGHPAKDSKHSHTPGDSRPMPDLADRSADGYPPIGDYALIGDCRSAALVSGSGSVDWLCLPRFDGPSVFGAVLDRERGGHFAVHPTGPFRTERRYLPDTNVLETTFAARHGTMKLLDFMPVATEEQRRGSLWPNHQLLRRVEVTRGEVEVEVVYRPRPDYSRMTPRLQDRGSLGIHCGAGSEALLLRSEIPIRVHDDEGSASGRLRLAAGERRWCSLVYSHGEPLVIPPFGAVAAEKLEMTLQWWRRWAGRCRYQGPHREAVVRSALALKLMTYAPSGAVVAAPTTSLPEWIGGVRNWDYRYCWLRDSSLILHALMELGYREEARAFLSWTLHSTRLTQPELRVLYDVHGESHTPEQELDHLEGYRASAPVRIGNGASDQLQLDVYGNVVDAAYTFLRQEPAVDRATARLLVGLGRTVGRMWREPDEGIWEIRARRRHHTYSKVMCWVALDRLIRLHETGLLNAPVAEFRRERAAIREEVETRGYDEVLGSYTLAYGSGTVDAALLLLPRYGFVDATNPRMRSSCRVIWERLGRNGLLYRYLNDDDGLPGEEGAFGICSFWGVECLALAGAQQEARNTFDGILRHGNDVGLFAEEIDPESGEALGNFPQAFTHVGLIDAALTLERCTEGLGTSFPLPHRGDSS